MEPRDSRERDHAATWRRRGSLRWFALLLALLIVVIAVLGSTTRSSSSSAATGSQPYAGTALSGSAFDFRLVDQHGDAVSLSELRGKVVVLAFMDSECKDICPLTAQQLRDAYQSLPVSEATSVILVAVNVDLKANSVADVATATRKWQLDEISDWHFLTGSSQALEPVWKAYGIEVAATTNGDLTHTPGVFVIDQAGQKRWYISTPLQDSVWHGPALGEVLSERLHQLLGADQLTAPTPCGHRAGRQSNQSTASRSSPSRCRTPSSNTGTPRNGYSRRWFTRT